MTSLTAFSLFSTSVSVQVHSHSEMLYKDIYICTFDKVGPLIRRLVKYMKSFVWIKAFGLLQKHSKSFRVRGYPALQSSSDHPHM